MGLPRLKKGRKRLEKAVQNELEVTPCRWAGAAEGCSVRTQRGRGFDPAVDRQESPSKQSSGLGFLRLHVGKGDGQRKELYG